MGPQWSWCRVRVSVTPYSLVGRRVSCLEWSRPHVSPYVVCRTVRFYRRSMDGRSLFCISDRHFIENDQKARLWNFDSCSNDRHDPTTSGPNILSASACFKNLVTHVSREDQCSHPLSSVKTVLHIAGCNILSFYVGLFSELRRWLLCSSHYYSDSLKGLYVVARIFFLLLLHCSACPRLVLLSKTYKPFSSPL